MPITDILSGQGLGDLVGSAAGDLSSTAGLALFGIDDYVEKITNLDLQMQNRWEFTVSRIPQLDTGALEDASFDSLVSNIGGALVDTAGSAIDALVTQLYTQSVSLNLPTLEMDVAGTEKYVKGIVHPENCQITFIEDEAGTVTRWLDEWWRNIVVKDQGFSILENSSDINASLSETEITMKALDGGTSINLPKGYLFKNNQLRAKRKGILQLKSVTSSPDEDLGQSIGSAAGGVLGSVAGSIGVSPTLAQGLGSVAGRLASGGPLLRFPTIQLNGMVLTSRGEISVSYDSGEKLLITASFSVDTVDIIFIS